MSAGIAELERGISLEFASTGAGARVRRECEAAGKLQHKMKLNLDMAKKRQGVDTQCSAVIITRPAQAGLPPQHRDQAERGRAAAPRAAPPTRHAQAGQARQQGGRDQGQAAALR